SLRGSELAGARLIRSFGVRKVGNKGDRPRRRVQMSGIPFRQERPKLQVLVSRRTLKRHNGSRITKRLEEDASSPANQEFAYTRRRCTRIRLVVAQVQAEFELG